MFDIETADFRRGERLELRIAGKKGEMPLITGYAAVYNRWSEDLGFFREIIEPGAFDSVLDGSPDVRAFHEHNPASVLGRTPKTLKLKSDTRGLYVEIEPPDTQLGRDIVESVRRGDVDGMSFGFRVDPDGASWNDDGTERRIIEISELFEVSIVSFPAYRATNAKTTEARASELRNQARFARVDRSLRRVAGLKK